MAEELSKKRKADRENFANLRQDVRPRKLSSQTVSTEDTWESTRLEPISSTTASASPRVGHSTRENDAALEDPWETGKEAYKGRCARIDEVDDRQRHGTRAHQR